MEPLARPSSHQSHHKISDHFGESGRDWAQVKNISINVSLVNLSHSWEKPSEVESCVAICKSVVFSAACFRTIKFKLKYLCYGEGSPVGYKLLAASSSTFLARLLGTTFSIRLHLFYWSYVSHAWPGSLIDPNSCNICALEQECNPKRSPQYVNEFYDLKRSL